MNYCKMALFHNKVKKEKIAQYLKFHDISFWMNFYKRAAKVSFSKALRVPWRQRPIINTLSLCKKDGRNLQDSFFLQQILERNNGFNEQRNCLLAAHNFAKYPFKKHQMQKWSPFYCLIFNFSVAADQEYNKKNLF